jgi:hypothetical protein
MANEVFANGREVSCKAADGKAICAFPDVCFTPPENPATPPGVPIPYPNTGMAKDTTKGSKTVKVSGKEVMLKNKSHFKKSTGDEPGSAAKKGVLTSTNRGKVYFTSWSMDVKFEGQNVVRHLDLTTHNHMSFPGNSPTWPYLDSMAFGGTGPCKDVAKGVEDKCLKTDARSGDYKLVYATKADEVKRKDTMDAMCGDSKCKKALKCVLTPYSPSNCCDGQTPHHIVPKSQFKEQGEAGAAIISSYDSDKAPCICVDGESHSVGKHGEVHALTNVKTRAAVGVESGRQIPESKRWTASKAEQVGAESVEEATGCPEECTKAQLRQGHKKMGVMANDKIRPTTAGGEPAPHNGFAS